MSAKLLTILNRIKVAFSSKVASYVCFIVALLGKWSLLKFYYTMGNDKTYQVIAARNLARGLGLTVNSVHAVDISREIFTPLHGYPPGYSLLIVPLYSLFRDFDISCLILDLITGLAFLLLLRRILVRIRIPIWLVNYCLLVCGFAVPLYLFFDGPTDFLSVVICLLTISLILDLERIERKYWLYGILIGLSAFALGQIRYMYVPISFIFPVFLFWTGRMGKKNSLCRAGIISGIVIVLGLVFFSSGFAKVSGILTSGNFYVGNSTHVFKSSRSFFPENLLQFYPYSAESLINVDFLLMQLSIRTGIAYDFWKNNLRVLSIPVQTGLVFLTLYFIAKKKFYSTDPRQVFFILGGAVSVATILLLAFLSATKDGNLSQPLDGYWTYLEEGRYYSFVSLFFFCALVSWISGFSYNRYRFLKKGILIFFFIVTVIDLLHGIYFVGKINLVYRFENPAREKMNRIRTIIKNGIQKSGEREFVVTSVHGTPAGYGVLEGGKTLFDIEEINSTTISSSSPAILLAVIEKRRLPHFQPFIQQSKTKLIYVLDDYYLYLHEPTFAK